MSGGARDIDFIETHVCTRMLQNTAHRAGWTLMILEIKKHREQARPLAAAQPRPGPLGGTSSCQGHRSQVCSQLSRKLPTVSASRPRPSPRGPGPGAAPCHSREPAGPHTATFSITLSATWTSSPWTVTAADCPHMCWWSFQSCKDTRVTRSTSAPQTSPTLRQRDWQPLLVLPGPGAQCGMLQFRSLSPPPEGPGPVWVLQDGRVRLPLVTSRTGPAVVLPLPPRPVTPRLCPRGTRWQPLAGGQACGRGCVGHAADEIPCCSSTLCVTSSAGSSRGAAGEKPLWGALPSPLLGQAEPQILSIQGLRKEPQESSHPNSQGREVPTGTG